MKFVIVSQYFSPVENAAATRTLAMAKGLRDAGHDVTVVTGMPNYPTGVKPKRYRWKPLMRESIDGLRVIRTYEFASRNEGTLWRLGNYGSFMISALTAIPLLDTVDCLLVSTPPLFSTFSARWMRQFRAKHLVCDVRDIWPRSIYELGHAKQSSLGVKLLSRWERAVYRQATALVAATEGIQSYLNQYCEEQFGSTKPVFFSPNGISEHLSPVPSIIEIPSGRFVLLYAGNLSEAQDLMQFLRFAARLKDEPEPLRSFHFLFVGDGELLSPMRQFATQHALDNVQLAGWIPQAQVYDIMSKCDACLISLKDMPLFRGALPSKTFEYMHFAKPIFSNVKGELQHVLNLADCAYNFEPHDYASFRACALNAITDKLLRHEKGHRAKQHVQNHYIRVNAVKRLVAQLEDLLTESA